MALIVITIQDGPDDRVQIGVVSEPALGPDRPPTGAAAAAVRMLGSLDFEQDRAAQPGAGLIRLS